MPHQEGHNELPTRHHQHGTSAVPFLIWWLLFCIFVTPLLIFLIPVLHLSSLINLPPFIFLSVFFFCSLPHYSTMSHLASFFFLHSLLSGWPLSEFLFLPHIPFVVSGERDTLLSRLADLLSSSSPQIGVHFEMASFVEESIMEDLLHYVIPHVCMTE